LETDFAYSRLLAELLRLQRWTGGDAVSAERIFGLLHGFETTIRQENESFGISDELRNKMEDVLEDVEHGKQATDGPSIKDRLHSDGIDEMDAVTIMTFCRLGSRFTEGVDKIASGLGSVFPTANKPRFPERDWIGAPQYMELVDCTEGQRAKMHAVFATSLPREGELVTPQNGSTMIVVGVEHVVITQDDHEGMRHPRMIPHVLLEPIDEAESGE
jgi:hypothetical protein